MHLCVFHHFTYLNIFFICHHTLFLLSFGITDHIMARRRESSNGRNGLVKHGMA